MTTPAFTKTCRHCGAAFTVRAGAAGATVHCQAHRTHASRRGPAKPKTWAPVACGRCGHVHTTLKCDRCGF